LFFLHVFLLPFRIMIALGLSVAPGGEAIQIFPLGQAGLPDLSLIRSLLG
jgi:hypothetical protein